DDGSRHDVFSLAELPLAASPSLHGGTYLGVSTRARSRKRQFPQRIPASSCSRCQFSRRSCLASSSNLDGLPSLSKCLAKRPSLRAKSMKLTSSLVLGFLNQSSLPAGLPCRVGFSLTLSRLRVSQTR